jgi:hypothetical protein
MTFIKHQNGRLMTSYCYGGQIYFKISSLQVHLSLIVLQRGDAALAGQEEKDIPTHRFPPDHANTRTIRDDLSKYLDQNFYVWREKGFGFENALNLSIDDDLQSILPTLAESASEAVPFGDPGNCVDWPSWINVVILDQHNNITRSRQIIIGPAKHWSVHAAELIAIYYSVEAAQSEQRETTNQPDPEPSP